jgi:hypothetical protein
MLVWLKEGDAMQQSYSDRARAHVQSQYFVPARRAGHTTVKVVAGEVHRALGVKNRVPTVCQALASRIIQEENDVTLIGRNGPPSGLSTTVEFTYRLEPSSSSLNLSSASPDPSLAARDRSFLALRGIAKEIFRKLGGGVKVVREERKAFEAASSKSIRRHESK